MASTTRMVKTSKVAWSGMSSPLTRLMMFVNDTGIVNESLRDWSTTTDKDRQARKDGARGLFARLQMAYVYEILEAIKDIRNNKNWMAKVESCPKGTQDHFAKACAFLDSPDYQTLTILRNNACFHYANKMSVKAVEDIARRIRTISPHSRRATHCSTGTSSLVTKWRRELLFTTFSKSRKGRISGRSRMLSRTASSTLPRRSPCSPEGSFESKLKSETIYNERLGVSVNSPAGQ